MTSEPKYDFNAQYIYNEIVAAQREIQNTRDAFDLEIQACKEQNSILSQEILNNQIKLKKCFSLQYQYSQFPRFGKNVINWTFFSAIREAETLQVNNKRNEKWDDFLEKLGAYCRKSNLDNDFSVVDLLTYSTIPTLFGFLSNLENSYDFDFKPPAKNISNFCLFTDFIIKEFLKYKEAKKNHSFQTRFETLIKFSRSVFVWPPFLHFVHTVFSPVIRKYRSYFSSILSTQKTDNDLLVNTTDNLVKNLLDELEKNIDLCPSEISYFLKSVQIAISNFKDQINNNETNEEHNDDGLKYTSALFYTNFLSKIFKEPRIFFIIDSYNDDSLFATDSEFYVKLEKSSLEFVKLIIKDNKLTELPNICQIIPKYIIIDNYDEVILDIIDGNYNFFNFNRRNFNDCLKEKYQIKQYHLFKVMFAPEPDINSQNSLNNNVKDDDDDDDDEEDIQKTENGIVYDLCNFSFNGYLCKNELIRDFQIAESLYNLIVYAPPLPNRSFELADVPKEQLFITVIRKVLVEDIYSLKNTIKRQTFFDILNKLKEVFPKDQNMLDNLFKNVKSRANPNSRLIPSKSSGEKKNLLINQINEKLLKRRIEIEKEKKVTNDVLAQESSLLYITLFRRFLLINHSVNPKFNEYKNEFLNKTPGQQQQPNLFESYLVNVFPLDSPSCTELAVKPNESQKCLSLIFKFHSLFVKEIGKFEGANEVINNSFFRHLRYYSYLIAKPQLIAKDMKTSARFVKCKAYQQREKYNYNEKDDDDDGESKKDIDTSSQKEVVQIDSCANFYLPKKVMDNLDLIESPRKKMASAFSEDGVPLKKADLLLEAFKEVRNCFILKRKEDEVEVIAYIIALLHANHFTSCYEFINDFMYHFDDDNLKLEIFNRYENFFDLLSKVSKRLLEDQSDILGPSDSSHMDELELYPALNEF